MLVRPAKARLQRRHKLRSRREQFGSLAAIGWRRRRNKGIWGRRAQAKVRGTRAGDNGRAKSSVRQLAGRQQQHDEVGQRTGRGDGTGNPRALARRRRRYRMVSRSPDFTARTPVELARERVMQLASAHQACKHQGPLEVVDPQQTAFLAQGRRRSASVASGQGLPVHAPCSPRHAPRQRQ